MSARRSPSRASSISYHDNSSRRSSAVSNPDIFSDEYALDPIDPALELSLVDSIQPDHFSSNQVLPDTSNFVYPSIPPRLSALKRPQSSSTGSFVNDNVTEGGPSRTVSTSSRFTVARAQSPYRGPTQPSHPYAMYPQITRASSIASESTIRPTERPFVPTGGPEHPYALYPQNTVPEEGDDIGTQPIPLGFPGMGMRFNAPGNSNSDVGDIVGTDGHIEQLPPYTRYADNIIAKGDMANIRTSQATERDTTQSGSATLVPTETSIEPTSVEEASETDLLNGEERKITWREKAQQKICGGIALWLLLLIIILIVFAGVVGGVIGGVVGRQQGNSQALQATATVTSIWLDADPASTDASTPACPTGRYTIPFNQTQEVNNCVIQRDWSSVWGCLDIAFLGITISKAQSGGPLSVSFEDLSMTPQSFYYGPQPPDFNGTSFVLTPMIDRDNKNLGVALFFSVMFDKLSILPGAALDPGAADPSNARRSVHDSSIRRRAADYDGTPLQIGDEPWFCFWNQTINEFWLFVDEGAEDALNASSTVTTAPSSTGTSSGWSGMTSFGNGFSISTPFTSFNPLASSSSATPSPTPAPARMAQRYANAYYPDSDYPRLIKMIEKRKPIDNTPPYCQKMQVLNNWQIVPREDNEMVFILESQYQDQPGGVHRRDMDSITDLESNCICEWLSD